jgi:hypothetical protein
VARDGGRRAVARRASPAALVTLGIHTPGLPQERDPAAVRRLVAERHIGYAIVLDTAQRLWDAFGNRYWPARYLELSLVAPDRRPTA